METTMDAINGEIAQVVVAIAILLIGFGIATYLQRQFH
jgi:hypothetical protein